MKRLSSLVLAALLLLSMFLSIAPSAFAETLSDPLSEPLTLPPGSGNYVSLKWEGGPPKQLLDLEGQKTSSGTKAIAFGSSGTIISQIWDIGEANSGKPSPIYSFLNPGSNKRIALTLDPNNYIVSTQISDTETTIPKRSLWQFKNGQLVNEELSSQELKSHYQLIAELVPDQSFYYLKFVTTSGVEAKPTNILPGQ